MNANDVLGGLVEKATKGDTIARVKLRHMLEVHAPLLLEVVAKARDLPVTHDRRCRSMLGFTTVCDRGAGDNHEPLKSALARLDEGVK